MLILSDFFRRNSLPASHKTPASTSDTEIRACSHGISRLVHEIALAPAELWTSILPLQLSSNASCIRSTFYGAQCSVDLNLCQRRTRKWVQTKPKSFFWFLSLKVLKSKFCVLRFLFAMPKKLVNVIYPLSSKISFFQLCVNGWISLWSRN